MMNSILYVGIGGFLGSILRYLVSLGLQGYSSSDPKFPFATMIVNIIGSFLIGYLFQFFNNVSSDSQSLKLFLMTGALGGFTTFSAFSLETYLLFKQGAIVLAATNVAAQLVLSLLAVVAGFAVASK